MSTRLRGQGAFGNGREMKTSDKKSREERLAEALRANLRRRKASDGRAVPDRKQGPENNSTLEQ